MSKREGVGIADQLADHPSSIGSTAPVMSPLSGPHRNTISAATFSAGMNRPVGCLPIKKRRSASTRAAHRRPPSFRRFSRRGSEFVSSPDRAHCR